MDSQFLGRLKLSGIFCQVVDSGSMTKAAREMNMSAPAVSQFINQLESALNTTLLYRSTRRITLSEAGKAYYAQSKKMLKAGLNAENTIHEMQKTLSGVVRITLPVGLATSVIAEALFELVTQQPALRINLLASDDIIDPLSEQIDISIRVGDLSDSGLFLHKLGKGNKHIFASPSYLARYDYPRDPKELKNHIWLGFAQKSPLNNLKMTHPEYNDVTLPNNLKIEFNDLNSLISHVKYGVGVAVLPILEIQEFIDSGQLVKILPQWRLPKHEINALTINNNPSYKVRVVLDTLKKYFKNNLS
jgi:DNA-binding transcriptional LysR family regulator